MPEVTPVEIRAAVAHSAQEPTEATQEWLNAAPERRRNLRPSGRGGCQGNKQNNNVENLEWSTHSEQMNHAVSNNLLEVRGSPKYSKAFKKEVLDYYNSHDVSITSLSKIFNISERTAGRIVNDGVKPRVTTRILKDGTRIVEDILSKEQVDEIKRLRKDGYTLSYIANMFNRSISQIHRVTRGESRNNNIE